ncbi:copper transporter [Staphylococcus chromogenes]|nr:copper transporter [Staphylococcus chromogenes]
MSRKKRRSGGLLAGMAFGVAAGVAAGVYVLAPNLAGGAVQKDREATQQLAQARSDAAIASAQAKTADSYIGSVAEKTVDGVLKDRPVLVLATADADPEDVRNITWLLKKAGAKDSGSMRLEEKFFHQDGADVLKSIVANTLPAGTQLSTDKLDPGTHAGEALGAAMLLNKDNGNVQADNADRKLLLSALRDAGYISYEEGTLLPAQLTIIVTGDSDGTGQADFSAAQLAKFAEAMDGKGNGVVLAGRVRTTAETGAIGRLRAAKAGVSTVDSVDRSFGRLATVLAAREQLAGHTGHYGTAQSAEAAAPARPE